MLAWVEAPQLAWASTGADRARPPPPFPPTACASDPSKVCCQAMPKGVWWKGCITGVELESDPAVLFSGQLRGQGGRRGGRAW